MGIRDLHVTNSDGTVTTTQFDYEWGDLLQERMMYLVKSDLWMLADRYAQLTEERQTELVEYRQALRDITKTANPKVSDEKLRLDPSSVTFPTKPS